MAIGRWNDEWDDDSTVRTCQAKVTEQHSVTLPVELCRALGIEVGDMVQFAMQYGTVTMHPAAEPPPLQARNLSEPFRDD